MTTIPKHFTSIAATIIFAVSVAFLLTFWYRLPEPINQDHVKGSKTTVDEQQQMFEACLAGQLGAEDYLRYKNGDQSILDEQGEKIGVCYSILAQP